MMVASPFVAFTSDGDDVVHFNFLEVLVAMFAFVVADTVAGTFSR